MSSFWDWVNKVLHYGAAAGEYDPNIRGLRVHPYEITPWSGRPVGGGDIPPPTQPPPKPSDSARCVIPPPRLTSHFIQPPNPPIDPVCLVHGKKRSEHDCLYCCLCFDSLTPEECFVDADDNKVDICKPCAEIERILGEGIE